MQKQRPILVVDDDTAIRQLIAEVLRDAGHEVVECSGGKEALACLNTVHPAVITLDLAMPSMDGIQFLQQLQKRPGFEHTPVIFITAAPDALRRAVLPKGHVTIGKPFYIEQLLHAVRSVIGLNQAVA
ncbi:MAG: response regulator [Chloroflexota bacterium]